MFLPWRILPKAKEVKALLGLLSPTFRCFMPLLIGCQLIQQSYTQDLVHMHTHTYHGIQPASKVTSAF